MTGKRACLVGTRHDFHGIGSQWDPAHVRAFVAYCATLVDAHELSAVCEEASPQSIALYAGTEFGGSSALGHWCATEGIGYLAFDLDDAERRAAGIPEAMAVVIGRVECGEEVARRLEREAFEGRERAWQRRIEAFQAPSLLIVVGARHIDTFAPRLGGSGWQIEVAEANWKPANC